MGPKCDLLTLQLIVSAHLGLYRVMEPRLRQQTPDCLHQHVGFRFREELARADLHDLGGEARLVPTEPTPDFHTNAEWVGYLYVVEGASLGGREITARLSRLKGRLPPTDIRTFAPYGDRAAPAWAKFLKILRAQLSSESDFARCARAARQTFAMHETFLTRAQEIGYGHR